MSTPAFQGVGAVLFDLDGTLVDSAPDLGAAADKLRVERGLPWGIVTNKATRFTQPLVQAMELLRGAGAVVSGDTTPHSKPHPEPLLEAARRLGVEPRSCIYVGDDERDIVAGEAAGMKTVAAVYGYLGAKAPSAWGADAMINSPDELLKLLGPD